MLFRSGGCAAPRGAATGVATGVATAGGAAAAWSVAGTTCVPTRRRLLPMCVVATTEATFARLGGGGACSTDGVRPGAAGVEVGGMAAAVGGSMARGGGGGGPAAAAREDGARAAAVGAGEFPPARDYWSRGWVCSNPYFYRSEEGIRVGPLKFFEGLEVKGF